MNTQVLILVFLLIGGLAGFLIGVFYTRSRIKPASLTAQELEKQYVAKILYEKLVIDMSALKNDLKEKEDMVRKLSGESSARAMETLKLKEQLETGKAEIEKMQERLKVEFENLANRIMKENSSELMKASEANLGSILKPLNEEIKTFRERVDTVYDNENKERASLKTEIKQLLDMNRKVGEDANNLALALKGDPKKQGDWGEFQLERLLELAGLQKDVHFTMQYTEDKLRPDCVINLPDNKNLVIDSKVSLTAYERYSNASTDHEREQFCTEHLVSLNGHIRGLSEKNYQNLYSINAPDFVLMFIPMESALAVAVKSQNTLFEEAMKKNIILVTGSILLATVRTIAYIWKQEEQKKNVIEIARQGGALYDKFVAFIEDMKSIREGLDNALKYYNSAMNKLSESDKRGDTIIGRTENLKRLGARASKQIPGDVLNSANEGKQEE